ncbi:MAG: hypothetical protein RL757_1707 [Bacteroidota bacterium]|jgi:hypothetical protein
MNPYQCDVVMFTLFRDDAQYSSVSMSLAKEFAKNHRVFYINHPYSFKDWWTLRHTKSVSKRADALAQHSITFEPHPTIPNVIIVTPPPTSPINFMSNGGLYRFFSNRNNAKIEETLRQTIRRFGIKQYVYYNCYNPFFLNQMPSELPVFPVANVYHSIDDLDFDPYTAKHGTRLERESIKNADIAITTSSALRKKYLAIKPNTEILTNAVDISIFSKVLKENLARPKEIRDVKTKIIGFTGNLDYLRIDYPLLKKIALRHSEKTLVIVGPINSDEFYKVGLDKISNVIFTGSKKIDELPNYVQAFDVAIIPFLLNDVTRSIYPLKINEYLAAGRAVVSTTFSDDIQLFKDVIYLADGHDDFLNKIDKAIAEDNDDRIIARATVANRNTWADRVEQFWDLVKNFVEKKKTATPQYPTTLK